MKLNKKSADITSLLTPQLFQIVDYWSGGPYGSIPANEHCISSNTNGIACSSNAGKCTNDYAICFNEPAN